MREEVNAVRAGVIGLSCALRIQSLLSTAPSAQSTEVVVASHEWPTSIPGAPPSHSPDYASMWAGAHVRPIPASTPQLEREARWLKETVVRFAQQLEEEPSIGLTRTKGVEFLDAPPVEYQKQTKASFDSETGLGGFRFLSQGEMPDGVKLGFEYDTFCMNSPVYCANLLRRFIAHGGKTAQRALKSEWEGFAIRLNVKLVVNASGAGFGDAKSFPTRGQTVITDYISATKTITRQNKDGTWSFIIPRFFNGGTIIGGTKEVGDWHTEASLETRQWLLEGGCGLMLYAGNASSSMTVDIARPAVISDVVGRRPMREGGMRIEFEEKQAGIVLHAYGAGGRGFELSWGVANEVEGMVKELLPSFTAMRSKL
ncbi:unnamed protein product [Clonostachys rhizophaga]|uniref:FAD dependent oxidoreductase domain-containing protein n=1 Tax=Clonostachys rhizophaga TaxID=160324 RepID=A0A9N9YTU2_9HYPO|nr:unnamed protein product [Clonostachys rhizophaga]